MASRQMHGQTGTPLYRVWKNMKLRCLNPNATGYENYGGRGIQVCDEWMHDYQAFHDWAMAEGWTEDLQIERIENDDDYSPGNCTFIDRHLQQINRRNWQGSDYRGVCFHKQSGRWMAYLNTREGREYLGLHETSRSAAMARDNFIIDNQLPHPLGILSQ